MGFQDYWYLLILLVLAGVTLFLFIKKSIVFIMEFKYMLPAIIFSGAIFVMLKIRFLQSGLISFNENFLTGKAILALPLEEWLFLLVISFFAFSVYILVNVKFENFEKPNLFYAVSILLLIGFAYEAWFSRQKLIPFFVFFLLAIYFGYTLFRNKFKPHLTKFYISYFIVAIPFFLIKIVLNALPVILYNNDFTLGIRLIGVPVEEFANLFLLMLINITIFEYLSDNHLY
jgi:hypothetical protein